MKNLAPIFVVLIILMAFISALSAQSIQTTRIYNPELPKHLVFQWRIETPSVHPSWSNEAFTIHRDAKGLVVYYGTYTSLADALDNMPTLPEHVSKENLSLTPFFNQKSITAADAFALMGNYNYYDMTGQKPEEAVSFNVYFGTYENVLPMHAFATIKEDLSFEIQPNRTFAYSAGEFGSLEEAETYQQELVAKGFEYAEVNKYLHGQRVAMLDMDALFAYVNWSEQ